MTLPLAHTIFPTVRASQSFGKFIQAYVTITKNFNIIVLIIMTERHRYNQYSQQSTNNGCSYAIFPMRSILNLDILNYICTFYIIANFVENSATRVITYFECRFENVWKFVIIDQFSHSQHLIDGCTLNLRTYSYR